LGGYNEARRRFGYLAGSPTSGNLFLAKMLLPRMPMPEGEYRIAADLYLFWAASIESQIVFLPDILGKYRQHGNNYYSVKKGRFGKSKQMLQKQLMTVLKMEELFEPSNTSPAYRNSERIPFPTWALAVISDSKLFSVDEPRLAEWKSKRILFEAWKGLLKAKGFSKKRSCLITLSTLLLNELLPRPMAQHFHSTISKLRS